MFQTYDKDGLRLMYPGQVVGEEDTKAIVPVSNKAHISDVYDLTMQEVIESEKNLISVSLCGTANIQIMRHGDW